MPPGATGSGAPATETARSALAAAWIVMALENSDVPFEPVAVDVTNWPAGTATGSVTEKVALPLASVSTVVKPRNVCPSPKPEESAAALAKNSRRNPLVLGVLLNVPMMVVLPPALLDDVITGKFWRSFGPLSASLESLGVTPSLLRSMPRCPLELLSRLPLSRMELPRIVT